MLYHILWGLLRIHSADRVKYSNNLSVRVCVVTAVGNHSSLGHSLLKCWWNCYSTVSICVKFLCSSENSAVPNQAMWLRSRTWIVSGSISPVRVWNGEWGCVGRRERMPFLLAHQIMLINSDHGQWHIKWVATCEKTCLRAYADSGDPNQPAHPHSLIRAFAVRHQNHLTL